MAELRLSQKGRRGLEVFTKGQKGGDQPFEGC